MFGAGAAGLREAAEARHGVEELIIDGGDEDVLQLVLHRGQLGADGAAAGGEGEAIGQRGLDDVDVGHELGAVFAYIGVRRPFAHQGGQIALERFPLAADAVGDGRQFLRRGGGNQPRRRGHQRAGALGDVEGAGHCRYAAFVHHGLGVAHAVEGEPGH